jgi:prophage regulatory protein
VEQPRKPIEVCARSPLLGRPIVGSRQRLRHHRLHDGLPRRIICSFIAQGDSAVHGHFDGRAIREMLKTAGTDPKALRRTIRRTELRQIVPLADSTIYEMERRGEFPQRFFLTPRCVVWDLAEVMAWLEGRRRGGDGGVKKAPAPDYRLRTRIR